MIGLYVTVVCMKIKNFSLRKILASFSQNKVLWGNVSTVIRNRIAELCDCIIFGLENGIHQIWKKLNSLKLWDHEILVEN